MKTQKTLDQTSLDILNSLVGCGRLTVEEARETAELGSLPRILRVLIAAKKLTKTEAKALVTGEEE